MSDAFREMERHNKAPRFFLVFFFALIAWGVYYIAAYTPQISGWSQYDAFRRDADAAKAAAPAALPRENPYEADPRAIAEGQRIYEEHCAGCHGKALEGQVGPGLTGHLAHGETGDAMYASISGGLPGGMPAFESRLGRDRIWRVLAYVDSVREGGRKP